jgi:hydroxymethylbilane synthase
VKSNIVIGTRASKLALWQAEYVASLIREIAPGAHVELKRIVTTGDKILDVPLAKIGGKGLFTKELENAMLAGEIDLAVHSLKDVPTELPDGLFLSAILERSDPFDAFVSNRFEDFSSLPEGACVGTSSLRRRAQLLRRRPDLRIEDLRGNIDTRLRKLDEGQYDAIVLAAAGLKRLGWGDRIAGTFDAKTCLPAVGQGVLAIESREGDEQISLLMQKLDHLPTRWTVTAERSFLAAVQGGCQVPVAVYGSLAEERLQLRALILSLDGKRFVDDCISGRPEEALEIGREMASRLMAAGGNEILQEIF